MPMAGGAKMLASDSIMYFDANQVDTTD